MLTVYGCLFPNMYVDFKSILCFVALISNNVYFNIVDTQLILCIPLNCRILDMDVVGTSDDNTDFTHCDDLTDSDLDVSDNDDDEPNLDPLISEELEVLILHMFELVQKCYYHLIHLSIKHMSIPQMTSMVTSHMWVYWVLTDVNQTTCYDQFRMRPNTFLKLCNTLK
jgi:hypothetical protein